MNRYARVLILLRGGFSLAAPAATELSVAAYPSIQAALDANPGRMLFVPAGDHFITEKSGFVARGRDCMGRGASFNSARTSPLSKSRMRRMRSCAT